MRRTAIAIAALGAPIPALLLILSTWTADIGASAKWALSGIVTIALLVIWAILAAVDEGL